MTIRFFVRFGGFEGVFVRGKLALVGNTGVGKTTVISTFTHRDGDGKSRIISTFTSLCRGAVRQLRPREYRPEQPPRARFRERGGDDRAGRLLRLGAARA